MVIIYAVRHPEYDNPGNLIPGRLLDVHISERGWEQTRKIADYFRRENIAAVQTSPLRRCNEAAIYIAGSLRLPQPQIMQALNEVQGPLDGTDFESFLKASPTENAYKDPRHVQGGGEMLPGIYERMHGCVMEYMNKNPNKNMLFVSHGDPIMALVWGIQGEPLIPDLADKNVKEGLPPNKQYLNRGEAYALQFDLGKLSLVQHLKF